MISNKKNIIEKEDAKDEQRKSYKTPQLTVHGTLEKITKAKPGTMAEVPRGKTSV